MANHKYIDFEAEVAKRKRYRDTDTSMVNQAYIDSLINDANKYFDTVEGDYGKMNWGNASNLYNAKNQAWGELSKRADVVGAWLYQNKDSLNPEAYNSYSDYIRALSRGGSDSVSAFKGTADLYSNFDSQEAYDVWKKEQDSYDAIRKSSDYDKYVEAGKKSWGNSFIKDILGIADTYNYNALDFVKDINEQDWKSLGGKALEQLLSKWLPNVANPIKIASVGQDIRGLADEWVINRSRMDKYLTDDEMGIYHYYMGKGDYEAAENYYNNYSNQAKIRSARELTKLFNQNLGETGVAFVSGIHTFGAGYDNLLSKAGEILYDKESVLKDPTTIQYAFSEMSADNSGLWDITNKLAQTIGNQLPSMALNAMTGGVAGSSIMGMSAAGNAYADMLSSGQYTETQALAYGISIGILEAKLQEVLGGITGLGSKGGLASAQVEKLIPKITKSLPKILQTLANFAANTTASSLDEAFEEAVQEILDPFVKAIFTGDLDDIDWGAVGESALLGGLSGGLLEGGTNAFNMGATAVGIDKAFKDIKNDPDSLKALLTSIAMENPDADISDIMTKYNEGKKISTKELKNLVYSNEEAIWNKDKARLTDLAEGRLTELGEQGDVRKLAESIVNSRYGDFNQALDLSMEAIANNKNLGVKDLSYLMAENSTNGDISRKEQKAINKSNFGKSVQAEISHDPNVKEEYNDWAAKNKRLGQSAASVATTRAKVEALKTLNDSRKNIPSPSFNYESGVVAPHLNEKGVEAKKMAFTTEYANVMGYRGTTNEAFSKYYKGEDLEKYGLAFNEAYEMGKQGIPKSELDNASFKGYANEEAIDMAYQSGVLDAKYEALKTEKIKVKGGATVTVPMSTKGLKESQKATIELMKVLAEVTHTNMAVMQSATSHGLYDSKTNTISIDINLGGRDFMITSLSHELTHHLAKAMPEKFDEFARVLFEEVGKVKSTKEAIEVWKKNNKKYYPKYTDAELNALAREEVVAEMCESFLTDEKVAQRISQKVYEADKGLWNTIKKWLEDFVAKIKSLFADLDPQSENGRIVRDMGDRLDAVKQMWADMVVEAGTVETSATATDTMHSFKGIKAQDNDITLFNRAQEMAANGMDSETIRKETGWFVSYDGKWRFEIDDSTAVWHLDTAKPDSKRLFEFGERIFKLSDLLEHPTLYEAYPQLKEVTVWENPNSKTEGYVVGRSMDFITVRSIKDTNINKDFLIHEIQHLIQNIEGFSSGASIEQFSYKSWGEKEYEAYDKRNEIAGKIYPTLRRHGVSITKADIEAVRSAFDTTDSIIDYNYLLVGSIADNNPKIDKLFDEYLEQVQILNLTTPSGQYHAVSGEIEAFDTQARRRMTAEERKNTRPNIDRKDVMILEKSKESFAYIGDTVDGRRCYSSGYDDSVSLDDRVELFKQRIATIFNLGAVELKTDVKKIKIKGDRFTTQKNLFGDKQGQPLEYEAKVNSLYDLADILATSTYDPLATNKEPSYVNPNVKPKNKAHKDVKYWYKFRNNIVFDGVPYKVTFNIRDKGKEQYQYFIDFKEDKTPGLSNTVVKNLLRADQASYAISIPQNSDLSTVSSKNIDGDLKRSRKTDDFLDMITIEDLLEWDDMELYGGDTTIEDISEELNTTPERIEILFKREGLGDSYVEDGRKAVMTQARINNAIEYNGASNPRYARRLITRISPKDFIDLTVMRANQNRDVFDSKVQGDHGNTMGNYDYEGAMKTSANPYLVVDVTNGRVIGHNGRHRMRAMELLGIESVEIEVELYDDGIVKYHDGIIDDLAISSQFDTKTETHLSNIIPLNESYRADIEAIYGENANPDAQVKYSRKIPDPYTSREALAKALSKVAKGEDRAIVETYKSNVNLIKGETERANNLRKEIDEIKYKKSITYEGRELSVKEFEQIAYTNAEEQGIDAEKVKFKVLRDTGKYVAMVDGKKLLEADKRFRSKEDIDKLATLEQNYNATLKRISGYDKKLLNIEAMSSIKRLMEREKKVAYDKAKAEGKVALKEAKEQAITKQKEITAKYQESRRKNVEGRRTTEMRHKLLNTVHTLDQLLVNPTKKKHIPIGLQRPIAEALEVLNRETDSVRMAESLARLKIAYGKILESDDYIIRNSHDDVISNMIDKLIDEVKDAPVRDMNLEQLELAYNTYRAILKSVRDANKSFKMAKGEEITKLADDVMGELETFERKKKAIPKVLDNALQLEWANLKPIYAFERIGSSTFTELYNNIRHGEDVWANDVKDARDFFDKQKKQYGFDKWDFKKKYAFTSKHGRDFELTLEQIMSIYAYTRRGEQAIEHLVNGGFVFDKHTVSKETIKGKLEYEVVFDDPDAYSLSEEIIGQINATLTEQQMAFARVMQEYLSKTMGEKGNEVSRQLYDINIFGEENYFPLKTSEVYKERVREQARGEVKIKNKGFTKETTPHSTAPVVLTPFTDVWATHCIEMSMYHAFTLPLEDFYRVYNYKERADIESEENGVTRRLEEAYGKAVTNYIDQLLVDVNGGTRGDPRASALDKFLGTFKKAKVMGSLSVVIQQPSAVVRAAAYIDPKYFVDKPSKPNHKANWEELKRYAPVAIIKEMGKFDVGVGQSTVDWIKNELTLKDKVDEVVSKAPAYADEMGWISIWKAVKREVSDTTTLKYNSEEFLERCGERFTEVISKTQVYDSVFSRSAYMRSKDVGAKMFTAFMAEPTTTLNILEDAVMKAIRGNPKFMARAITSCLASSLINSALVSVVYAMRDDEDEEYWKKYLSTLGETTIDNINPLNMMPYIRDIWSMVQGYRVSRSDLTLWQEIIWDINKLNKNGYAKFEDWVNVISSISQVTGIPIKNLLRDARGIWNTAKSLIK